MNDQNEKDASMEQDINRLKDALKENETYINYLQQRLVEVNQTRDKFISILSHDLRSPMTTLLGLLGIIESGQVSQQELMFILPNLKNNVKSVLSLIDDLLSWSLQNQKPEQTSDIINLNLLIQDAYSIYSLVALNKQIIMENNCQEGIFFSSDYNMVRFIIRNLIGNALKFSLRGSKIITASSIEGNLLHISVNDQGIGMSKEKAESLFNGINNSVPGTENERGTGLGLYLCKEYLDMLNGSIEVSSQLHQGTTFTIKIPMGTKMNT